MQSTERLVARIDCERGEKVSLIEWWNDWSGAEIFAELNQLQSQAR